MVVEMEVVHEEVPKEERGEKVERDRVVHNLHNPIREGSQAKQADYLQLHRGQLVDHPRRCCR